MNLPIPGPSESASLPHRVAANPPRVSPRIGLGKKPTMTIFVRGEPTRPSCRGDARHLGLHRAARNGATAEGRSWSAHECEPELESNVLFFIRGIAQECWENGETDIARTTLTIDTAEDRDVSVRPTVEHRLVLRRSSWPSRNG